MRIKMNENLNQISEQEKEKLIGRLKEYAKAELKVEERKILDYLECGWDEEDGVPECSVLTEKQEGDPEMEKDGSHDWKTIEDYIDEGKIIIRYIADWKGTLILFKLYF